MRTILSSIFSIFAPVLYILSASSAYSQTMLVADGRISAIWLSTPTNAAFRVWLKKNGVDQLSQCGGNFIYMNTSDGNYQARSALFLTAYSLQKPVALYFIKDSNNFCVLAEVYMEY